MLILTESIHYVPVLVDPRRFDELWSKDDLYLESWNQLPRETWFIEAPSGSRVGFIAGLAAMSNDSSIGFTNGRHRTRWLLEQGIKRLPICMPPEELDQWLAADLILATKQPIQANDFPKIGHLQK